MKKHPDPKRKIGKHLEPDMEMIERCIDGNDKDSDSDDYEGEDSYQNVDELVGVKANVKPSKLV